jgi:hypothetical protein
MIVMSDSCILMSQGLNLTLSLALASACDCGLTNDDSGGIFYERNIFKTKK